MKVRAGESNVRGLRTYKVSTSYIYIPTKCETITKYLLARGAHVAPLQDRSPVLGQTI